MQYNDLDRLDLFTRVTGVLENLTPLRVGAGREAQLGSPVDLEPLRVRLGDRSVPYIPGSSLKGVFRSLAEAIARAEGHVIHDPWDFEAAEQEARDGKYCLICGIFGSTRLASHVRIYDAYPKGTPTLFMKTGVGINRDFRGAHPNILYTERQVEPGHRWSFMMDIVNIRVYPEPGDERGRILRRVLDMLAEGMVQVGARKTVGYGLLRLVEGEYVVYGVRDGRLQRLESGKIGGGAV
ncbi:type III CRISPR-associated RAMP protein Csx7 [Thermofilum pendens]|uniref:CRISPR-associated RAMP protein, SSO1426 family n=1 Tax=Thermofilum pendens (strain DSM 2475 / Hrk 5) TaxID=368408 RepID=A1RZQ5_THEPD|nr:CRISPR-associated RAMP protein Csx7 [Thermofilum pendens]ABL78685.1 CRISPR-associated RAMP protein, SSO1426 family [Thermofilum pendens Hrk 5]